MLTGRHPTTTGVLMLSYATELTEAA